MNRRQLCPKKRSKYKEINLKYSDYVFDDERKKNILVYRQYLLLRLNKINYYVINYNNDIQIKSIFSGNYFCFFLYV